MITEGPNKREGQSRKELQKELHPIINKAWEFFPKKEKEEIVALLVEKWKVSSSSTVFCLPEIKKTQKTPFVVPLCVLSSDWPGLSDSCIGVLHERGWNLSYMESFIIEYEKRELGIVLLIIGIKTEDEKKKFFKEKNKILKDLKVVSAGSKAKTSLLAIETKKLKIFGHVTEKIKEISRSEQEMKDILKDDGEAFKFFSSRSESYLEERSYADLAQQIVTNYRFQELVRKTGGKPQFWLKNITTTREHLTGITIAAFERDIYLNDWLEAIYQAVPDYNIKYNKEFVTEDGIVVYRIEMCDRNERPYAKNKIIDIKNALTNAHISRRIERVRWMELTGGFEQYIRAIIPLLVKEYSNSMITQVYISIVKMTNYFAKFKILIVSGIPSSGRMNYGFRITETLEKENGISIISTKPPKKYGNLEVDIIDIEADLNMFSDIEDIYRIVRGSVRRVIGEFRDFDEGMRRLEVNKLTKIKKMLKAYPLNFVREFYYRLDDFYRIGAEPEEIAEQIKLGIKGLEKYETGDKRYVIIRKKFSLKSGNRMIPNSTIVVLVYSSKVKLLSRILELLQDYEVTLSKIERKDAQVVILRIQKNNKPIPLQAMKRIKHFLETKLILNQERNSQKTEK